MPLKDASNIIPKKEDTSSKIHKCTKIVQKIISKDINFSENIIGTQNIEDIQKLFEISNELSTKIVKDHQDTKKCREVEEAHTCVWGFINRIYNNSRDKNVRDRILDRWNRELGIVPSSISQIAALYDVFNRDFLTDQFWQNFIFTNSSLVIMTVCYAVYQYVNKEELQILNRKLDKLSYSTKAADQLMLAISWSNCNLTGSCNPNESPFNHPSKVFFANGDENTRVKGVGEERTVPGKAEFDKRRMQWKPRK